MGCFVPEPVRRYADQESQIMLGSQGGIAPQQFNLERMFRPAYAGLDMSTMQQGLFGGPGQTYNYSWLDAHRRPQEASFTAPATPGLQGMLNQWRQGQISDVAQLGPSASAAFRNINPQSANLLDTLTSQAQEDLGAGASLSPSIAREVSQGVRAGQSARGLGYGQADVFQEAMARGLQGAQFQDRNRQFAGNVLGLNKSMTVDPFLQMLGGGVPNVPSSGGPQQFNPFNAYASDLFGSNQNNQMDVNMARANFNNAMASGFMNAGSSGAGGLCGGAGGGGGGGPSGSQAASNQFDYQLGG